MPDLRSQGHTGGAGPHPARPKVVPFGKYLLLERVSVGGMAEVYKAKAFGVEGFEKILAIKRILPTIAEDEEFIDMFIDEAKIVGQLSHANICQVLELGRIGDSHFIAMEYIWGRDLLQIQSHFRRQKQVMPVPMAVFIMSKICEGLDYAHRKRDPQGRQLNIVHRDVSPQNCLVAYEGATKVIDFGIARAAYRQTRTQAGVLKGKFGYMSPEQVRGLPIDRRSDLFAVGTLTYELLTGERLFLGESDFSTLDKVRNAEVEPPTKYNRNIPPDLERIVMKALTKDPNDRWQWASELQEALQRVLINFKPVFTTQKLSAWMKQTFASNIQRDKAKMEEYAQIGQEVLQQARKQKPPTGAAPKPPQPSAGHLSIAGAASPPLLNIPAGQGLTASPSIMTSTGEQVSIDAADMDWLMAGADDDDDEGEGFAGESTVIADIDVSAAGGLQEADIVDEIPDDFEDESFEGDEATAIYFVNEEAMSQPDGSDLDSDGEPISDQSTRLLDHSVSEQSTVIFDQESGRHATPGGDGVSISPSISIQNKPGDRPGSPQPETRSEVSVPMGAPGIAAPIGRPAQFNPPAPPLRSAPQMPGTMPPMQGGGPLGGLPNNLPPPPGTGQHLGAPGNPAGPASPGAAAQGAFAPMSAPQGSPYGAPPMPPGQTPSQQLAPPGGARPGEPPLQTEFVRGKGKKGADKKRSPLILIALAAVVVVLLGGIAGVVVLFVLPSALGSSETPAETPQSTVANVSEGNQQLDTTQPVVPEAVVATDPVAVPDPALQPALDEGQQPRLFLTIVPETATVEIDGNSVDLATLSTGLSLAAGDQHTVRIAAPGRIAQELTLSLTPGQEERRDITLAQAGQLALISDPSEAEVQINGEPAGSTPLTVENLDYGDYSVRFALKGYDPIDRSVSLSEGEPQKQVSVNLEKIRVAQNDNERPPRAERDNRSGGNSGGGSSGGGNSGGGSSGGGGQGFLVVSTQPWGHVYVDGSDTGRDTPILPSNPLRLSAGRHRLTIQTNNGQRFTFTVTVNSGETTPFMRRLDVR